MATASGIDAQLGIVDESTYSTYVVPTRFHEIRGETLKFDRGRIKSQGIRAGRRVNHRWAAGVQRVTGGWDMELAAQGTGLLFKHMFGAVTTTGTNPYTHTFTPGTLDGKSFTCQVGRPDGGGTVRPHSYVGCKITGWEIGLAVDEIAKLHVDVYGAHEDTGQSLASASYTAGLSPFVFTHGSLTVAGSEQRVTQATLSGDNALKTDRHLIGASNNERPKEPLEEGERTYGGTLTAEFDNLTAYNRYVNGTEAALVLTLNISASALLTFTTNVRFDGETPNVGGKEMLALSLPFECTHATSDASAITAALVNAEAAP